MAFETIVGKGEIPITSISLFFFIDVFISSLKQHFICHRQNASNLDKSETFLSAKELIPLFEEGWKSSINHSFRTLIKQFTNMFQTSFKSITFKIQITNIDQFGNANKLIPSGGHSC